MKQIEPKKANQESIGDGIAPPFNLKSVLRIYDLLDKKSQRKVREAIPAYIEEMKKAGNDNPYEVPIQGTNWAGNTQVMGNSFNFYLIWKQFPELVNPELIFKGLNYIYGCHPYSNVSFVTAVGVNTKKLHTATIVPTIP